MRNFRYAALGFTLVLLAACASFDARLATAARVHASVTSAVTDSLDAHVIDSEEATRYQVIAVKSSEVLDSARDLKDSDPKTAAGKLRLASGILGELNEYLLRLQLQKGPQP